MGWCMREPYCPLSSAVCDATIPTSPLFEMVESGLVPRVEENWSRDRLVVLFVASDITQSPSLILNLTHTLTSILITMTNWWRNLWCKFFYPMKFPESACSPFRYVLHYIVFISNTMIFWKLVIKCPRKPREVCGIPEGAARGNSTNLPRVQRDI
jgi:hypothetical protein